MNNKKLAQKVISRDEASQWMNHCSLKKLVYGQQSLKDESLDQYSFKVNYKNHLSDFYSHFLLDTLNAARYRNEILEPFVNQFYDDELQNGFFQQDGAPIHCTMNNLNFLRYFSDDCIIGRNTEIPWPPRSCNLTTCDIFLWPHLKSKIFQTPVANLENLQQRIIQKCLEMNNNPIYVRKCFRKF